MHLRIALRSALLAVLSIAAFGAASASAALPVEYSFVTAQAQSIATGAAAPAGANDWNCKPSSSKPRPVVLVHGTVENQRSNWNALSPLLKNDGYCVFTFNYGEGSFTLGQFYGLKQISQSAAELKIFVDKVLAATGKSKVDLVGHSQGGMMPRWYIQFLGGAAKVQNLVALAPSNNGTTLSGIAGLADIVPGLANVFVYSWCESCKDQVVGSAALTTLNAGGGTSAGVKYTNIVTKYDEVVTPYTSGFLSGSNVSNITVQDGCEIDFGEHLAISYDRRALYYVRKALGSPWWQTGLWAPCTAVIPLVGG
ncbi:MAG: alpha/beta fold hydrolase [Actinobacteria bacterium]|nr:alpha/beta fold hydrolase [Actinomycetota bacterium]